MKLVDKYLTSKSKASILRYLCKNKDRRFYVSELSEHLKINKSIVSKLITELGSDGIVFIDHMGPLKLCKINLENREVAAIMNIFEEENKVSK